MEKKLFSLFEYICSQTITKKRNLHQWDYRAEIWYSREEDEDSGNFAVSGLSFSCVGVEAGTSVKFAVKKKMDQA